MSFTKNLLNKAPVPYVRRDGRPGLWTNSGAGDPEAMMKAMGAIGTLFSIVNRTSTSTAAVDWKLWRKASSGKKEDRTEVTTHPALVVWERPNEFYTRQEMVESSQQHIDLTGEGWWILAYAERGGRRFPGVGPIEMWPVRPDKMRVVKSPTEFLTGYIYVGPEGEKIPLGRDEVIQIRMPNPLDPYRGMGPVQSLLTTLDGVKYSAEWNRNFFLNSAEPGGIIEVPERLSDDEFNEMRTRWNEQHKGVANAHRVAILEHGSWKDRKYTQRDMQFVELAKLGSDTIREAFGIHKHVLGQSDDVNRANASAASEDFAKWMTVPRLDRIKGALNNDFLPLFGRAEARGLEFDYENAVPENAEDADRERDSKARAWAALVSAGAHPDDASAAVGLPIMRTVERPQPREEQMA
jgi:HK97 family phage portal protein